MAIFDSVSTQYGGSEWIILMLSDSNIIDRASLRSIDTLTRRFDTINNRPGVILTAAFIIAVLSVVVIPKIQPESNYINYFSKTSPVRQAHTLINEKFGGASTIKVIVNTGHVNGVENPEFLQRLKTFQTQTESIHNIAHPMSIVDLLEEENKALHQGKSEYNRLPESGIRTGLFRAYWSDCFDQFWNYGMDIHSPGFGKQYDRQCGRGNRY